MHKLFCSLAALFALSSLSVGQAAERSAVAVIQHHYEAFKRGDVDALLSDYSSDAIAIMPTGNFSGTAALRKMFEFFTDPKVFPGGRTMSGRIEAVDAHIVLEHWTIFQGTANEASGADVFIVRDGKIVFHTIQPPPLPGEVSKTHLPTAVEILAHHLQALRKGDVSAVVADYADDAVILTAPGELAGPRAAKSGDAIYVGKTGAQELFTFYTAPANRAANQSLETDLEPVSDQVVRQYWTVFRGTPKEFKGLDVFVIRNGKIVFQQVTSLRGS
jgi:ketosteroid isomerase-like protein